MFKEKLDEIKERVKSLIGKNKVVDDSGHNNSKSILYQQIVRASVVVVLLILIIWLVMVAISDSAQSLDVGEKDMEDDITQHAIDLPDKALDAETYWRHYFEEDMVRQKSSTSQMIAELAESQDKMLLQVKADLAETLEKIDKLNAQQREEFEISKNELQAILDDRQSLLDMENQQIEPVRIGAIDFIDTIEYDEPKPAIDYIPEGTFFSGYLLGGIIVSTALNTPDENATPVTIRLQGRGNLDSENKLDISKCKIIGSSYGDLSSERAVIRLEKMICKEDGMYITSDIAGIVYGDDGLNGIKGTVISTSSKHLKNAAIGGLISGLTETAKGKDEMNLSAGGLVSVPSKGMDKMLQNGAMSGLQNVGSKLADYYLRQAEAMSPVLTVPAGVRVNAQITKGFFVGERGIRRKIQKDRKQMNAR